MMIIIILTACNGSSKIEKPIIEILPNQISESPSDEGITIEKSNYDLTMFVYNSESYNMADDWSSYLSSRFNINLELSYIDIMKLERSEIIENTGLVYIDDESLFDMCIACGLLLPITDFISETQILDTYRQEMLDSYRYNGEVYGVPGDWRLYWSTRFYYKDWMGDFNPVELNNISDFYDYIKFITLNDLDGNGVNDTPAIKTSIVNLNMEIPDVQKAFGCYFNYWGQYSNISSSLSFNPNLGSYEDTVFSENIYEYLYFIKNLVEENIMSLDQSISNISYLRQPMKSEVIATFWGGSDNIVSMEEYINGSATLKGINSKNLNYAFINPGCYAVLKGTTDIKGHLQLLFDNIAYNQEFVLALRFGNNDTGVYSVSENFWVKYNLDAKVPGFNVPNTFPMFYTSNNPDPSLNLSELRDEYLRRQQINLQNQSKLVMDNIYVLPWNNTDSYFQYNISHKGGNAVDFNKDFLEKLISNDVSIEEAVMDYRKVMITSGLVGQIDILNQKIGSKTNLEYNIN